MFIQTKYFSNFNEARAKKKELIREFPDARIVEYARGYAVQYRCSGGYYPNTPTRFDRTGEWNVC